MAHFGGGARYVARSKVGQITPTIVRARSSPFSAVKMGGPFSLRCLSPLCSPAVGGGQGYPLKGKMVSVTGLFCRLNERRLLLSSRSAWSIRSPCRDSASVTVDGGQAYPLKGKMVSVTGLLCRLNERRLLLLRSWRRTGLPLAGWDGLLHRTAPDPRAARPVAERRSESAAKQGAMPDPRAVAPVVPRR